MPNLKIEAKKNYDSVVQRNEHAKNILKVLDENKNFLLLGHTLPDADCISSLCAWALIIVKLKKKVSIYLPGNVPEQIAYLLDICRYNQISVFLDDIPENLKVEAIFILDTPKPEMIDASPRIWKLIESPDIIKAEIDHHLESDASSLTAEELRFVSSASSTCELIAYLIYKIGSKTDFVKRYETGVLFTRNVILSILTGIIGDTKNGVRFVSKRDKRMFNLFSKSLESKLDYLVNKLKVKKFTLHIHPYVAAYVNQGMVSLKRKWQMKYGFGIKVIPNQNLAMLEYKFYDPKGEEIDMKEEFEIK